MSNTCSLTSTDCFVPYVCTLSPSLRLLFKSVCEQSQKALIKVVETFVHQFEHDAKLKDNIVNDPNASLGRVMRQVDVINPDTKAVIFKIFMSWDHKAQHWHVFMELPIETCIEDGTI